MNPEPPFFYAPEQYQSLLDAKVDKVSDLLSPYQAPEPEVVPSPTGGFRMRAEFRVWHDGDALDYVMFRRGEPKTPIAVTQFPIACDAIQSLMGPLIDALKGSSVLRERLFQLEFLSTIAGDTLVTLIYHRKLDDAWASAADALSIKLGIAIVGRSRKQKIIVGRDFVTEELTINGKAYRYQQYEQAFTQPNAVVNTHMIEWAIASATQCSGNLLELYCGNGNFTLPLAQCFDKVIATELSKVSTRAGLKNIADNQVTNVDIIRLSAEEVSQAMAGEREFRRLAGLATPLQESDRSASRNTSGSRAPTPAYLPRRSALPNPLRRGTGPQSRPPAAQNPGPGRRSDLRRD